MMALIYKRHQFFLNSFFKLHQSVKLPKDSLIMKKFLLVPTKVIYH